MEYKDIEKVNSEMSTTDIKGKDYVEVNQRIKAFRKIFPLGSIRTDIVRLDNGMCLMIAKVFDENGNLLGTGHAYENEGSTFINKTSYIENCETSAVGRALGMLGLGIDTSVASAEEVQNAINNQEPTEEEAKAYTISFGKHKGKTLEQLLKEDKQYVQWMINNKSDDYFKKCYEILSGEKLPTDEQMDERITLLNELQNLELELDIPHEKTLEVYKVDSTSQMTVFQLTDAIQKMKGLRK